MFETIVSPLAIILSLSTSTGLLLHETKMDKMAALAFMSPISATGQFAHAPIRLEGMPHTHVEEGSFESASSKLRSQNPSTTPRKGDKRYRLQKKVSKGFHAFDRYNSHPGN